MGKGYGGKSMEKEMTRKYADAAIMTTNTPLSWVEKKPPWQWFMDLNWKMGKPVLKEGAREAIVEFIKWLVSSRKRQPAAASMSDMARTMSSSGCNLG